MNNYKSNVTLRIKKNISSEAIELRNIAYYQPVKEEHTNLANDICSLQALHDFALYNMPDINWLASIVFEAGRITGIREERQKRGKKHGI